MAHVIRPEFGETRLDALQRHAFRYFLNETNSANGLVADRTQLSAPASIAAVGFALGAYPVGVERGWMTRTEAIERTLASLRFFWTSPQGTALDVTGYNGFYLPDGTAAGGIYEWLVVTVMEDRAVAGQGTEELRILCEHGSAARRGQRQRKRWNDEPLEERG